jgi:hypothetical protein
MNFYLLSILLILSTILDNCKYDSKVKINYPVSDNKECVVAINVSEDYKNYISHPLEKETLTISKNLLSEDSIYSIKVADEINLPSLFFSSEELQIQKTPNTDSMARAIIKQYKYYKVDIEDIEVKKIKNKDNVEISRLSFKMKENNYYMNNYILFINNRAITIGAGHTKKDIANKFDEIIINLKKRCP